MKNKKIKMPKIKLKPIHEATRIDKVRSLTPIYKLIKKKKPSLKPLHEAIEFTVEDFPSSSGTEQTKKTTEPYKNPGPK